MRRLSIELSDKEHQQIKAMAAMEGQSIKDFVIERVLPKTDGDKAWEELKDLLYARIEEAKNSEPIRASLTELLEQRIQETQG